MQLLAWAPPLRTVLDLYKCRAPMLLHECWSCMCMRMLTFVLGSCTCFVCLYVFRNACGGVARSPLVADPEREINYTFSNSVELERQHYLRAGPLRPAVWRQWTASSPQLHRKFAILTFTFITRPLQACTHVPILTEHAR